MIYVAPPTEVEKEDPFKNDKLQRREVVETLTRVLERQTGPFVLAIDSPWGTGKTTTVRMVQACLEKHGQHCVYYNAWEADHSDDPLVSLIATLSEFFTTKQNISNRIFDTITALGKASLPAVAKLATNVLTTQLQNVINVEKARDTFNGILENNVDKVVKRYQEKRSNDEIFKDLLKKVVDALSESSQRNLIVFVDEIDRCRPSFAIALLERIKHHFDTGNITFVLSLDKPQLEASIKCVYGESFDSREYLRRFFHLDFRLPKADTKFFIRSLLDNHGIDNFFTYRNNSERQNERADIETTLHSWSNSINLTARQLQRCVTRLCIVLEQIEDRQRIAAPLIVTLILLRSVDEDLFFRIRERRASHRDIVSFINRLPFGPSFLTSRIGIETHAQLIAAEESSSEKEVSLNELRDTAGGANTTFQKLLRKYEEFDFWGSQQLSTIIGKIDLAQSFGVSM